MAVSQLIQGATFPSNLAALGIDNYQCRMPHTFLAGNCIIVAVSSGGADPSTITDDGSNSYSKLANVVSGGQAISLWVALNIAAGGRVITVNMAATTTYVSVIVMERNNIVTSSALDGSNSGAGTSNSLSVTSFTPANANGFVVNFATQDGTQDLIDAWTAGAGFNLELADIFDSQMIQVQHQTTATAVTAPATKTDTGTRHWTSLAICLKTTTQGTARPSTTRCLRQYHFSPSTAGPAGNSGSDTSPRAFNAPCEGNLMGMAVNFPNEKVTALSDNASQPWVVGTAVHDVVDGNSGWNACHYALNTTGAKTRTITVTWDVTGGDGTLMVYDFIGAGTAFDKTTNTTGQNAGAGDFTGNAIATADAGGLVFGVCGIDASLITGVTGGMTYVTATSTPNIPTSPIDQNNGYYFAITPSTATITNTFQHSAAVHSWADIAVAFRAPAAGGCVPTMTLLGVGRCALWPVAILEWLRARKNRISRKAIK